MLCLPHPSTEFTGKTDFLDGKGIHPKHGAHRWDQQTSITTTSRSPLQRIPTPPSPPFHGNLSSPILNNPLSLQNWSCSSHITITPRGDSGSLSMFWYYGIFFFPPGDFLGRVIMLLSQQAKILMKLFLPSHHCVLHFLTLTVPAFQRLSTKYLEAMSSACLQSTPTRTWLTRSEAASGYHTTYCWV